MAQLAEYVAQFGSLKKAPLARSPLTLNKYPNKPILLLSVLDLIGGGFFDRNRLYLCPEVADAFDRYWDLAAPAVQQRNVQIPFQKLESSDFWHPTQDRHPFTRVRIAQFDAALFAYAQDPESRAALQSVLIERHFAPEIHDLLRVATRTTEQAFVASTDFLSEIGSTRDDAPRPVRSQAFRVTVVRAYQYTCAICGVRIFDIDGRSVVEAAHIRPWSVSHDDHPTNGLSLCKLCHWSFDAGLLGVSDSLTVLTSPRLSADGNVGGYLTKTSDRSLLVPREESLRPASEKLAWHRDNIFGRRR